MHSFCVAIHVDPDASAKMKFHHQNGAMIIGNKNNGTFNAGELRGTYEQAGGIITFTLIQIPIGHSIEEMEALVRYWLRNITVKK